MTELHIKLREARKAAGLSQEEIGAACTPSITKAAVGLWETDDDTKRTQPKLANLQTVAKLTNRPLSYFLTDDEPLVGVREIQEPYHAQNVHPIIVFLLENQLNNWYKKQPLPTQVETIIDLYEILAEDVAIRENIKDVTPATLLRLLGAA